MSAAAAEDLVGVPLFADLEPDEREALASWFEIQEVSADVKLTGEGASGYSFFVIREGTATVTIDGNEVRTLEPGDFFGELAILGDGRRTATVTTA
jgi:CRP-like cAMP-binding protein